MKNIQVIDGADNCTYDIFAVSDKDFKLIFPGDRDIEFVKDFVKRVGGEKSHKILSKAWKNWVNKKEVNGIHGTLFFELDKTKKKFYPNRKETDIWVNYRK